MLKHAIMRQLWFSKENLKNSRNCWKFFRFQNDIFELNDMNSFMFYISATAFNCYCIYLPLPYILIERWPRYNVSIDFLWFLLSVNKINRSTNHIKIRILIANTIIYFTHKRTRKQANTGEYITYKTKDYFSNLINIHFTHTVNKRPRNILCAIEM